LGFVPSRLIFRCEYCGTRAEGLTEKGLETTLQEFLFGEYLDVEPGHWLTWTGNGIYGRTRYACGEHRGELKAEIRESYGTLGWHPWAMGPHPINPRRGRIAARRALGPGRPSRWSPLA
jgi:hypothetical protein